MYSTASITSRIIFYKWTNRLKTPIFHYIQPYLRLKSKQSIDMAGPCSILMNSDYTEAKLCKILQFSSCFCLSHPELCSSKSEFCSSKTGFCSSKPDFCSSMTGFCFSKTEFCTSKNGKRETEKRREKIKNGT